MAGESAGDYARRLHERAAQTERRAQLWELGAEGERITGELLDRLEPEGWIVLHDQPWPGRQRANIDHIVIGPGGVFTVDSKNWSGRLEVRNGVLRQNGRSRETAVVGVGEAAVAVTDVLRHVGVQPVMCFVRDEPVLSTTRGVELRSTANLLDLFRESVPVLTPESIAWCVHTLRERPVPMTEPREPFSRRPSWSEDRPTVRAVRPSNRHRADKRSRARSQERRRQRLRAEAWKLVSFVAMTGVLLVWLNRMAS